MKAFTFNHHLIEKGIRVTERNNQACLQDYKDLGRNVPFSIFYPNHEIPASSNDKFEPGLNTDSLVTTINQYVQSDGSAFCLVVQQGNALAMTTCNATVPYVLVEPDVCPELSLVHIGEGGHITLWEKVGEAQTLQETWKIFNSLGILYCQRLQWGEPWWVNEEHLFARLDKTSMLRISLDRIEGNSITSTLELMTDRGWMPIEDSSREFDYEYIKDNAEIVKRRLAARCNLAKEMANHAEFLYPGRLNNPR